MDDKLWHISLDTPDRIGADGGGRGHGAIQQREHGVGRQGLEHAAPRLHHVAHALARVRAGLVRRLCHALARRVRRLGHGPGRPDRIARGILGQGGRVGLGNLDNVFGRRDRGEHL